MIKLVVSKVYTIDSALLKKTAITAKTQLVDFYPLNTSLVAPGGLANCLQRRNARKANEADLNFPNLKMEITSQS